MSSAESTSYGTRRDATESPLDRKIERYKSHVGFLEGDYGVDPRWLPLAHRTYNPFEALLSITPWLAERPVTVESVTAAQLRTRIGGGASKAPVESMALVSGWWSIHYSPSSGQMFANPAYCHGHDPITDVDERIDLLGKAAQIATLPQKDLASAFGVASRGQVHEFSQCHGTHWNRQRKGSIRSLSRTWMVLNELGYSTYDIADAFGKAQSTVSEWTNKYVEPEFDPTVLTSVADLWLDEVMVE